MSKRGWFWLALAATALLWFAQDIHDHRDCPARCRDCGGA